MPLYFIMYSVLFWVPVCLFVLFFFGKLPPGIKRAYWLTTLAMAVISVIMEYFYLKFDTWTFSERIDPLLGIWFGKAPIEEYVYWFGATPFCLALYLLYCRLLGRKHA